MAESGRVGIAAVGVLGAFVARGEADEEGEDEEGDDEAVREHDPLEATLGATSGAGRLLDQEGAEVALEVRSGICHVRAAQVALEDAGGVVHLTRDSAEEGRHRVGVRRDARHLRAGRGRSRRFVFRWKSP